MSLMSHTFSRSEWNKYALSYDALNGLVPYTQMHEHVVHMLRRWKVVGPLLDAGCGTGNFIHTFVQHNTHEVVGIDGSFAMLERARQKCNGRVTLHEADLNAPLPFEGASFGTIVCINALYATEEPRRTLQEFRRILSDDGILVIATPKQGYENGLILKAHCKSVKPDEYWLNAHASPEREKLLLCEAIKNMEMLVHMFFVTEINRQIAQASHFHFFTKEELADSLHGAGFNIVGYEETYAAQSHLVVARAT